VIIEDCGDVTLEQLVKTASVREKEKYYMQALDILISIQSCIPDPASIVGSRYFDKEKFLYELHFHFCDKLINGYLGYTMNEREVTIFEDFFNRLSVELSEQPYVLVHRDFQSSNLIYMDDSWIVIDHQDARMGLALYDLVSLIEDVYVPLEVPTKALLRSYYHDTAVKKGLPLPSADRFVRIYDLITIQRKLHDAGAFYFCFENFGNIKYLSYITIALQQALDIMSHYGEFARSFEILTMISHANHTKKQAH
jgi:aminoglycoside/choline kinase family phosphotransferase